MLLLLPLVASLSAPIDAPQDTAASGGKVAAFQETLVGPEGHRYAWKPDWLKLPEGMELGNTHGCVAVDSKGRVFFNTDAKHAVVVVDADGNYLTSWGEEWAGGLHGMTIVQEDGGEFVYLAHTGRHEIAKATLDGKVVWTAPYPKECGVYEKAGQYRPTGIAVAPNGEIYVGDGYGQSWCHRFSAKGEYLSSFGGGGTDPGKMRTPHGMLIETVGEDTFVLVCDRENNRLQRFTLEGEFVRVEAPGLRRPCNGAFAGDLLAIADLAGRVTLLGLDGKGDRYVVAHLGDNPDPKKRAVNGVPREQWNDGEFLSPHGIAADADGNLYVLDWNRHGRVSKLVQLDG
ncbi:MAG: 6-bladed beta-propeller [Planctomycetota bacterium]